VGARAIDVLVIEQDPELARHFVCSNECDVSRPPIGRAAPSESEDPGGTKLGDCPLCASTAPVSELRDYLDVRCPTCGDFLVTRAALLELAADGRVQAELARQTRWIARGGGRAFIGAESVADARVRVDGGDPKR